MDNTLFLGNGLNRTLGNGLSWEDLMKKLSGQSEAISDIPFPIMFEMIAAQRGCQIGRRKKDPYKELRSEIVTMVSSFEGFADAVHSRFAELPVKHVVTTNYDQVFEGFFDDLTLECTNPGSSRNILSAIYSVGDIDFYHAHGIDRWKNTLCLGHEHYVSLIGKIRSSFYPDGEDKDCLIEGLVKGEEKSLGIWPEYLFTTNVAIVGLGLDYCETDLWWLLALRASVFSSHNRLLDFENQIVYYLPKVGDPKANDPETAQHERSHTEALKSLGVDVKGVEGKDYREAYEKIARSIHEDWSE